MKIFLVACWLFDNQGEKPTYGGSQRYCIELGQLLKSQGYNVEILQRASKNFNTSYNNLPVRGFAVSSHQWGLWQFSYKVKKVMKPQDLAIYVYQETSFPFIHTNAISIQHGLNWNANDKKLRFLNTRIIQPFMVRKMKRIICVDTAYINWLITQINSSDDTLAKCRYIPNFVDNQSFMMKESTSEEKIVLFPRRMVKHRGVFLAYEAMKKLWDKGLNYKIIFCGHGDASASIAERAKADGFEDLISIIEVSFDDMPAIYKKATVSIIPTIAYEGTSLSAIESMATGVPPIVTYIGGLGNIVISNHNGMCITPTPTALADSLEYLLNNDEKREIMARNCLATAKALDINVWKNQWIKVVKELCES